MYMRDERWKCRWRAFLRDLGVGLAISLIATIYLGVLPGRVLDYAMHSAQDLMK